jgi:small-conductance mechanosensitive channel
MMDSEGSSQSGSAVDLLANQVEVLLAMLARPVVQRQILAAVLILLIAWVLPEGIRRWRKRRLADAEPVNTESTKTSEVESSQMRRQRWLPALYHLLTPILALVLLQVTVWLFAQQGYPSGLLNSFANLIWIWLIYRAIVSVLYARYGQAVRPYRSRIITPLFVFLIILQLVATLPGSASIAEVTINFGVASVNLESLFGAIIVFYLFIVAAWVVEQIMVRSLPSRLNAEPGVIVSFATLTRYALLSLGFIVFLGMLGLDFTSLAIIAGGLSVGIGIGLQDIVSNFVSGLVLLFEQSLKPGDVVELNGRISRVEKISLRATIVRTLTNEELIIPNASFTTNQVKNLTKSDRLVRVIIPFGVSYKSDPELVRQLAVEAGQRHPLALADPPPTLLFRGYGESSIDFELLVSVNRPELTLIIKSDLYYMLWDALAEHDITIPFPQRDLNLGDGWEKLTTELQAE